MVEDGFEPRRGGEASPPEVVRYSDEVAREVVRRVAQGESLMSVERDPAMPSRNAIHKWRARRPAFCQALSAAQRQAKLARRAMDRVREAGRLVRPKAYALSRSTYGPEVAGRICERLANGESLIAICRDPEMPATGTVYRWVQAHPEFEDQYVEARRLQADYLFDEAREVALSANRSNVAARRLHFDIIRWQASLMAPNKYCERLVVVEGQAGEQMRPMTVVVKRFTDPPEDKPQTPEEREALRVGKVVWTNEPGVRAGDLMAE